MKVYSYANPFNIDKADYWDEIKTSPHLCISQTLVQGLTAYFDRTSFTAIDTIQSFLNEFYNEWENSPENDIAQYVQLSNYINSITSEKIKSAMKFNKREVRNALRTCVELDLEPEKFNETQLTEEQIEFKKIYENIRKHESWRKLDNVTSIKKVNDVNNALKALIVKEINKELGITGKSTRAQREKDLKNKIQEAKIEIDSNSSFGQARIKKNWQKKLKKYQHLNGLDDKEYLLIERKIFFHGIHQFTPIIWKLINHLEELGIEAIFLINYNDNYQHVYHTWANIYNQITDKKEFDKNCNEDSTSHKELGRMIGDLLEGKRITRPDLKEKIQVFDNLTSFSDYVSDKYEEAKKKKRNENDNTLKYMSKQFYAVRSENINEILKVQYPEQFGQRHFLAYPIGAFILGLYNMWNSETKKLEIDDTNLKECLSIGFWKTDLNTTPISIFDRISLYFKNVTTLDDYICSIEKLKEYKISLNKMGKIGALFTKMSVYSVSVDELEYFENILKDLKDIAEEVFQIDTNNKVDYKQHFKRLMDTILKRSEAKNDDIDQAEIELVNEIAKKLESSSNLEVKGTIEDLKEALHFYLNRKKEDRNNSANWIVRDFEQIDGGILLSRSTSRSSYHYALLSDSNMKGKERQAFNWPITKEMMESYKGDNTGRDILVTAKEEYKNFLRFSLFYGIYFLSGSIELSFIENSEGEKEVPYFILSMLGLKTEEKNIPVRFDDGKVACFEDDSIDKNIMITELDRQMFSICPYRYLLNSIMENDSYYRNEYQIRYYYIVLLRILAWEKSVEYGLDNAIKELEDINKSLRNYLPFWNDVDIIDIVNKAKEDLKKGCLNNNGIIKDFRREIDYVNRKINFLVATYKDKDNNDENLMQFYRNKEDDIRNYLANNQVNEFNGRKIEKICEYCNQREVCLNHFVEGEENA